MPPHQANYHLSWFEAWLSIVTELEMREKVKVYADIREKNYMGCIDMQQRMPFDIQSFLRKAFKFFDLKNKHIYKLACFLFLFFYI